MALAHRIDWQDAKVYVDSLENHNPPLSWEEQLKMLGDFINNPANEYTREAKEFLQIIILALQNLIAPS